MKYQLQDGSREWITCIACICADSTPIPPGLIHQANSNNIQGSWLQDSEPSKQCYFFTSSPFGWTNDDIGYAWLTRLFDVETKKKARLSWRLLIVDSHGSHLRMKFIEYCDANRILLATYPPHSTHTLQPLDVGLFGPLAAADSGQITEFLHDSQGLSRLTKRDFFRLFWKSYEKAFTPSNIQSAFEATGLHPFNPDRVVARFRAREGPSTAESSVVIPQTRREIQALVEGATDGVPQKNQKKVKKLTDTILTLSTEVNILEARCKGYERTIYHEQQRRARSKPFFEPNKDGGAVFYSPSKVQQTRDLQVQKEEVIRQARMEKENLRLQKEIEKEEKRQQLEARKEKRAIEREQRLRLAEEKEVRKADKNMAKQASSQLHDDIGRLGISQSLKGKERCVDAVTDADVVEVDSEVSLPTTTRRGRQVHPPRRYGA